MHTKERTYFPEGNGDENCPECHGSGRVFIQVEDYAVPVTKVCKCVLVRDVIRNMEKGWKGLSKASSIDASELRSLENNNVWVTSSLFDFRKNLRHVAARMGPNWAFTVKSDADLMVSWLASIALKGADILDPDAASVSLNHLTLVDLVEPPDLLVIRLGVKAARNVAMPEVLMEALTHRSHLEKPTWVFDQPSYPLREGHIAYSEDVMEILSDFRRVSLTNSKYKPQINPKNPSGVVQKNVGSGRITMSSLVSPAKKTK